MHLILSSANELVSCDWKLIVNFFVVAFRDECRAEHSGHQRARHVLVQHTWATVNLLRQTPDVCPRPAVLEWALPMTIPTHRNPYLSCTQ